MTICYSDLDDVYCHRARILMCEKVAEIEFRYIESQRDLEDLLTISPYHVLPALTDRDFFLYESRVIMDYINERYPFPPMYAGDTKARAKQRQGLYRLEQDWYQPLQTLQDDESSQVQKQQVRVYLLEAIKEWQQALSANGFLLSDSLSIVDCYAIPVLWRLPVYGIKDQAIGQRMQAYMRQVFGLEAVQASLTPMERSIRNELP